LAEVLKALAAGRLEDASEQLPSTPENHPLRAVIRDLIDVKVAAGVESEAVAAWETLRRRVRGRISASQARKHLAELKRLQDVFGTSKVITEAKIEIDALRTRLNVAGKLYLPGLHAEFFENETWTGTPKKKRIDKNIDFDWSTGKPDKDVRGEHFTVRWTGFIRAERTARYTFFVEADDTLSLQIAGNEIAKSAHNKISGEFTLAVGRIYPVKIEFKDGVEIAKAILSWKALGLAEEPVPARCFLHRATSTTR
jgi:hypothetical protein